MSTTGTLRVSRPTGRHRDSRRSYRVVVDGEDRGALAAGAQLALDLPPGRHRVRAAIDWTGSPEAGVDVVAGRTTELRAEPAGPPWLALVQLLGRSRYLRLGAPERPPG